MPELPLSMRPTVIGGDRLDDDYCVIFEGRSIGRIRLAEHHVDHVEEWRWNVNPPLPIPDWANGSATTLEGAQAAFRSAWEQFYARLSPEQIERWHKTQDACRWG